LPGCVSLLTQKFNKINIYEKQNQEFTEMNSLSQPKCEEEEEEEEGKEEEVPH
jgi:hypothetical protein